MAAKSLEGANQVWNRVKQVSMSVEATLFFKALKTWLSTQKGNPRLQFLPFSNVTVDQITAVDSGGGTLYAAYAKKRNTATDAFFKINDSATLAGAASGANITIAAPLLVGGDELLMAFYPGIIFATGFVVASETTAAGGADTVSGDGPDGFLIIG